MDNLANLLRVFGRYFLVINKNVKKIKKSFSRGITVNPAKVDKFKLL